MTSSRQNSERENRGGRYALRRGLGTWEVTFEGRRDSFPDEQGAEYVVWLLLHPPPEPIHAVALVWEAQPAAGHAAEEGGVLQQRNLGRDDAEAILSLRREARRLGTVLTDKRQREPAKAEARRKQEEIREFLRKTPWRTQDAAHKCVRAVDRAIKRLCDHLARGVDAEGKPHPILQEFARHLWDHLLIPSGRGDRPGHVRAWTGLGGCFTYEPPPGVVWKRLGE